MAARGRTMPEKQVWAYAGDIFSARYRRIPYNYLSRLPLRVRPDERETLGSSQALNPGLVGLAVVEDILKNFESQMDLSCDQATCAEDDGEPIELPSPEKMDGSVQDHENWLKSLRQFVQDSTQELGRPSTPHSRPLNVFATTFTPSSLVIPGTTSPTHLSTPSSIKSRSPSPVFSDLSYPSLNSSPPSSVPSLHKEELGPWTPSSPVLPYNRSTSMPLTDQPRKQIRNRVIISQPRLASERYFMENVGTGEYFISNGDLHDGVFDTGAQFAKPNPGGIDRNLVTTQIPPKRDFKAVTNLKSYGVANSGSIKPNVNGPQNTNTSRNHTRGPRSFYEPSLAQNTAPLTNGFLPVTPSVPMPTIVPPFNYPVYSSSALPASLPSLPLGLVPQVPTTNPAYTAMLMHMQAQMLLRNGQPGRPLNHSFKQFGPSGFSGQRTSNTGANRRKKHSVPLSTS
jgi:hypothetical protein